MPGDGGDSSTWAILVAAGSASASAPTGRRPSWRSAVGCCWPRASSGSTAAPGSTRVVVAVPADWEEAAIVLAEELVASKVAAVVTGGATRAESVRAALEEIPDDALVVIVHDAARPLVDDAVIERVLAPLAEGYDGVVPGLAARRHGQARRGRRRRRDRRPRARSSPCRRRRHSPRRRSGPPIAAPSRSMPPTARRSSRRVAAGSGSSRATSGC